MARQLTFVRPASTIALLAAILLIGTLLSLPQADAATVRATKLAAVNKWRAKTLNEFNTKASSAWAAQRAAGTSTGADGLDWSNDGCSITGLAGLYIGSNWSDFFRKSCLRHDFGYRNLGKNLSKNLALRSTVAAKKSVDSQFLTDMKWQCKYEASRRPGSESDCTNKAGSIYTGINGTFGKANTAFFNKECTPGALCLYDDNGYEDRRITFSSAPKTDYPVDYTVSQYSNLDNVTGGFGDKTSAVYNRSSRAWKLYDDDGYKDRSLCVEAGAYASNLDDYNFGDKTSSIKQLSGASC